MEYGCGFFFISEAASHAKEKRGVAGTMEETGQHYMVALSSYAQQLPSQPREEEVCVSGTRIDTSFKRHVFPVSFFQALAAWESVGSVMSELGKGDGELQLEESAFQLLFAAVGLHLLEEPLSAAENVEVSVCVCVCVCVCVSGSFAAYIHLSITVSPPPPQDLKQCYSDMKFQLTQETAKNSKTPRKGPLNSAPSSSADAKEDEISPSWVEVIVDILLGFLSQPSQLWRSVVDQVFRRIVHRVTPGVIRLIANVRGEGEGGGRREGEERRGKIE